jgi:hypothetical protein
MLEYDLKISTLITKLKQKHAVTKNEVWECFINRTQGLG